MAPPLRSEHPFRAFLRLAGASAHESNLPFLASAIAFDALMAFVPFVLLLLTLVNVPWSGVTGGQGEAGSSDPTRFLEPFLPPHPRAPAVDPLAGAERILVRIGAQGKGLSLVALPLFLWFATRLFAGIRGSLHQIYGAQVRRPKGGWLAVYCQGKLRDLGMVLVSLALLLTHTWLSGILGILSTRGVDALPQFAFLVSAAARLAWGVLAFGLLVALFLVLYRYGSFRRLEWRGAVIASIFTALAFDVAKRLFGWYLTHVVGRARFSVDANVVAVLLAMVWMWYTAFVFLLGAVVADTWEHPDRPHRGVPVLS